MPRLFAINVSILLLCASALQAQTASPPPRAPSYGLDLGISYTAEHSLKANTSQSFWMQGGSVEFGVELRHGWGIAADIAGEHVASVVAGGVPFSEVTETFGPRYRWHSKKKLSVYGEGLFGEADGFDSVFPTSRGAQTSVNTLAVQVGGGVDYQLSPRFSVRAIEASWVHTQFPNSTDNDQNNIRLGAGVVLRFGR